MRNFVIKRREIPPVQTREMKGKRIPGVGTQHLHLGNKQGVGITGKEPYEMNEDDIEFLIACDKYRRHSQSRWLKVTDYLIILKSLGWQKPENKKVNSIKTKGLSKT